MFRFKKFRLQPLSLRLSQLGGVGQQGRANSPGHHPAGDNEQLQAQHLLLPLQQQQTHLAAVPVAVPEPADAKDMVRGAGEGQQLLIGIGISCGIELVGTYRQLLHPPQICLCHPGNIHMHVQRSQKLLRAPSKGLLCRLAVQVRLVHLPAVGRVLGDEAHREFRQVGQPRRLVRVIGTHLGVGKAHLVSLKGVVVHEGHRLRFEVQGGQDRLHRAGLVAPGYLGTEKVVGQAELLQLLHRAASVILGGDGLDDSPPVQLPDGVRHTGAQRSRASFGQGALPDGPVQIPDHTFDLGRSVRHAGHLPLLSRWWTSSAMALMVWKLASVMSFRPSLM